MCLGAHGVMFFVAVVAIASVSTSICQMNKAARLTSAQDPTEIGQKKNGQQVEHDSIAGIAGKMVKW